MQTFNAWTHPDDLSAIPSRERLGALLDRRADTAQALEDALVLALLVEAFGGPDDASSAHDRALLRLFQARLASSKIDHDLRERWQREVGPLPEPYRRPEPQPVPTAPAMNATEQWMERGIKGAGVEAMRKRLAGEVAA